MFGLAICVHLVGFGGDVRMILWPLLSFTVAMITSWDIIPPDSKAYDLVPPKIAQQYVGVPTCPACPCIVDDTLHNWWICWPYAFLAQSYRLAANVSLDRALFDWISEKVRMDAH